MRNFENNYNDQDNERETGWESIGDDDFERRRTERANRRYEAMKKSERARTNMINLAKNLGVAAFLAITVAGVATSGVFSTHEIMGTNSAENVETISVESVTLTDGPNIRSNPNIPNREDGSTVIMDFGEEGQVARIPYQGEAYYYHDEHDANGGWYGFPADEFADELFENAFISQKEANRLKETDGDGVVWVNEGYVDVHEEDTI